MFKIPVKVSSRLPGKVNRFRFDLAFKIDGILQMLTEVKAIGIELKKAHVKQAIDNVANQAFEWVALTNGTIWQIYNVTFMRPIGQDLVIDVDFSTQSARGAKDLEALFMFCIEGMIQSILRATWHTTRNVGSLGLLDGSYENQIKVQCDF